MLSLESGLLSLLGAFIGVLLGGLLARWVMRRTHQQTVALMQQPRRVEVRVTPPELHSLPVAADGGCGDVGGAQGWFLVWYESSKGWMLADVFVGEGAFVQACAEAAKFCALREEGLRGEVERFAVAHPGEPLPMKPRDYLVLPAVVFRAMGKA